MCQGIVFIRINNAMDAPLKNLNWIIDSYPGAIMILFKSMDGRVELHGSYMHTSAELEQVSTIWNTQIDAMVIYNNPRSVFRKIQSVIFSL